MMVTTIAILKIQNCRKPLLRVKTLESLLTEKGYIERQALDELIETYETKIGPRNGAKVVAKAWTDRAFHKALMDDATKAIRFAWVCWPSGRAYGGR